MWIQWSVVCRHVNDKDNSYKNAEIFFKQANKCYIDLAYAYVCPSHAGIVSKRLNISSNFFHLR